MTVSSKDGKELSTFSYTYDHAGNKLTSTETVDGKESKTEFSYDVENRLLEMKSGDKTITYTYDKNGNRVSSGAGDAKLDYIYDTENRLLAVKDKEGLLFAALYDGDDNRVFTASRTQATNTYQLFKRKPADKKRKSPYTAPDGEANSLFWYGFTQNVVQFFSSFTTSEGYDWIETFDTVSTAYHQKVAKDRATAEGLVVNPPSEDNLPGEDEVLYRSQVQDVLIPYTTKEDTYNYYETRNYVNDVNQQHTQVLQTYDDQLQKRETYVYGNGRATYTDESTGDSYHYLTSQSGSVTGLTQNGSPVASSSYNLYGATKQTTDTTGNPFAYNGGARDITGLDYLRARYYDSQAGTFLTADTYPGSQTDPLSQNLYTYVQNNPANYTDPSGHIWKTLTNAYNTAKKAVSKAYNAAKKVVVDTYNTVKKAVVNTYNTIKSAVGHAVNWVGQKVSQAVNWAGNAVRQTTNWIGQQWNNFQTSAYQAGRSIYNSASQYVSHQYQQAKQTVSNAWEQAKAMGQSVYNWGVSKSREAMNIARSWTKSLEETFRHSCETASFANGGTTVYASEIDFTSVKNTAQDLRLQSEIEDAKNSKLSDIEKSDLIVKAYEDYLYNKNKEAFDEYWSARKGYKQWKPENGNYADTVERRLGRKLQNSGINMKELMQEMGDEILSANSNASYIPFVAGSKVSASIQDNYQFYNLVNTGQPLDLKSRAYQSDGDTGYSIWSRDWGDGVKDDYAGNYLYGYVGKGYLNSSDTYLKISAGAAQEMSDIKKMGLFAADWKAFKSFITGNYFDNSGDSKMIQDGIDDYKLKGGSE